MKNFNEKYTIIDFIDKNKWSNVYGGINNETNEKIILNMLINVEKKEKNLKEFKEELELIKDMDHTNLISINEISTYINKDKTYYYVESECFEGITLKELRESTNIDEVQSLEIVREVIKGIKEFNDRNLNYGYLTDEDIIINEEGIVKVDTLSFINKHEGHLNYDEVNNKKFDSYEDVYIIGCILCELITGKSNFDAKDNYEDLDVDLMEIIMKSTNMKHMTKHKYKNIDEFLYEVISYVEYGEIKHKNAINLEKIRYPENNSRIKKYIIVSVYIILLISGVAAGGNYIFHNMNKDNSTKSKPDVSENTNKEDENKDVLSSEDTTDNLINKNNTSTSNNTDAISNKEESDNDTTSDEENKDTAKTEDENTTKDEEDNGDKESSKDEEDNTDKENDADKEEESEDEDKVDNEEESEDEAEEDNEDEKTEDQDKDNEEESTEESQIDQD